MRTYIFIFLIFILYPVLDIYAQKASCPAHSKCDSVKLPEVVISATVPFNNKQVETFYKTNTISTIDNIMVRLSGMSLIRRGSYAMEPSLNGFTGGQLSLTIDGMKMFGACTDKMDPITSYVEPSNLKSITILNGSGGSAMGSSIGGSVDMALQEPVFNENNPYYATLILGNESVSRGSTTILSGGYARKNWQYGFNGAYRKNESYRDGSGNVVPFTQFEKSNFHSVIKYKADSIQTFKADMLVDVARNIGYASLPMDVGLARALLGALEYRRQGRSQIVAKLYYNTIFHRMDDSKRDSAYTLNNTITGEKETVYMHMDMPGRSSTLGAYAKIVFDLNSHHKISLQADNYTNHSLAEMTMYMRYPEKPPETPMYLQTWPDIIRNVSGIYIKDNYIISQKLLFNLSGRVDYNVSFFQSDLAKKQFSVFGSKLAKSYAIIPKGFDLSLQYFYSSHFSMKGEAGYSERAATISEQFGYYLYNAHDGYDYIGNPDIKPERSDFGRLELQYTRTGFTVNLSQSLYLVHDYIMGVTHNEIAPMNFNTNGTRVYTNRKEATLYSSNLQVQAGITQSLTFFLLSKYIRGQLYTGEPLPLIAPLNNTIVLNYQKNNWSADLENEVALAQNRINTQYGEIKSPAFARINLKYNYHFMFLKPVMLDLSLSITNVTNATYYEHLDWGRINRPGRSFDILFKFSY